MSNPFGEKALESARVTSIMNMFWRPAHSRALQVWPISGHRMVNLIVNKRSGADSWYSEVLDACRLGCLSQTQYAFLHGLPTNVCGSWEEQKQRATCGQQMCAEFSIEVNRLQDDTSVPWTDLWMQATKKVVLSVQCGTKETNACIEL